MQCVARSGLSFDSLWSRRSHGLGPSPYPRLKNLDCCMGLHKNFRSFAAFLLEGNSPVGTCFVVEYEKEVYLVTAKHVVEEWPELGKNKKVYVRMNGRGPGTIKIPVLKKW